MSYISFSQQHSACSSNLESSFYSESSVAQDEREAIHSSDSSQISLDNTNQATNSTDTTENTVDKSGYFEIFANKALIPKAEFLAKQGLSLMPVAPRQKASQYPKRNKQRQIIRDSEGNPEPLYNGKNPSYLYIDSKGITRPRIVFHSNYRSTQPTTEDLKEWFQIPETGIGCVIPANYIFIDFDVKNFENLEDCETQVDAWINKHSLGNTWIERTHSGGFRIVVKSKEIPDFKPFSMEGIGGKHHGEVLKAGDFTVLAPTVGHSGNYYTEVNLADPIEIENLETIEIYAVRREVSSKSGKGFGDSEKITLENFKNSDFKNFISITKILSPKAQEVLEGNNIKNDRSHSLTLLIKEISGWIDWLSKIEVGVSDDLEELISQSAIRLGIDKERVEKIIASVNRYNCYPAIYYAQKDLGCWRKIKPLLKKEFFDFICPSDIKAELKHSDIQKNENEIFIYKIENKIFESHKPVYYEGLKNWLEKRKYTPTRGYVVKMKDFYFPDTLPKEGYIVVIKSPTGTNKTRAYLALIKQNSAKDNLGAFIIVPRNKIADQVIGTAEKDFGFFIYHLNKDRGSEMLPDTSCHQILCGESLHKIDGYIEGRDVILDEFVTVLQQLLGGGTAGGKKQAFILAVLERVFQLARNVYLMDANARDIDVQLIADLAPNKKVIKILNDHPIRKAEFTFIENYDIETDGSIDIKVRDRSSLVARMLNCDKKNWLVSDSKKELNAINELLKNNDRYTHCLTQESSVESWVEHKLPYSNNSNITKRTGFEKNNWADEFLENPKNFVNKYQLDDFLGSPTMASGVSYTPPEEGSYFNQKLAIFVGVIDTNEQIQMLGRNRDNTVTTYVYCPKKALIPIEDISLGSPEAFKENQMKELQVFGGMIASNEQLTAKKCWDRAKARVNPIWNEYRSEIEALRIFEAHNARACLIFALKELGHEVNIISEESNHDIKKTIRLNKGKLEGIEALEIYKAEPFDSLAEARKAQEKNPSKLTFRRVSKTKLLNKLPGIDESPVWSDAFVYHFWINDRQKLFNIEKYFLLTNSEIETKSNEYWNFIKSSYEFQSFATIKNDTQLLLHGLRILEVDKLIKKLEEGHKISKNSPEVEKICSTARKDKTIKKIKKLQIGVKTTDGKEKIAYIRKILNLVGVDIYASSRKDKESIRHYIIDPKYFGSHRKEILNAIERRFKQWLEETYQTPEWEYLEKNESLPVSFMNAENESEDIEECSIESSKNNPDIEPVKEPENDDPILLLDKEGQITIIENKEEFNHLMVACTMIAQRKDESITNIELINKSIKIMDIFNENEESREIIRRLNCVAAEQMEEFFAVT